MALVELVVSVKTWLLQVVKKSEKLKEQNGMAQDYSAFGSRGHQFFFCVCYNNFSQIVTKIPSFFQCELTTKSVQVSMLSTFLS